jgi:hypothetical protein
MFRNRNLTLVLALAAGLLGGFLSRYITPQSVYGQAQTPNTVEIRSQRFSIVDSQGRVVGTFTGEITRAPAPDERLLPRVALVDPTGRELWSAGGSKLKPLDLK